MSIIHKFGENVVEESRRKHYFDERRKDVDYAWATYLTEVLSRIDNKHKEPYAGGFEGLAYETDAFVKREAERFARSCQEYRIYEDDFESQFRFIVLKAALMYEGEQGTFFDYLRAAVRNAGRDMIRAAKRQKRVHNHTALSIDVHKISRKVEKEQDGQDIESEVMNRMLIEEMSKDNTLTPQEKQLFDFLRRSPDATLQEMADELGLRDRKQASRIKERLARKLRKYLQD